MPPLGPQVIDVQAVAQVSEWIRWLGTQVPDAQHPDGRDLVDLVDFTSRRTIATCSSPATRAASSSPGSCRRRDGAAPATGCPRGRGPRRRSRDRVPCCARRGRGTDCRRTLLGFRHRPTPGRPSCRATAPAPPSTSTRLRAAAAPSGFGPGVPAVGAPHRLAIAALPLHDQPERLPDHAEGRVDGGGASRCAR